MDFFEFLFPKTCPCCRRSLAKNERVVCTWCRNDLPETQFHLNKTNATKKIFGGKILIQNAISLLFFEKKGKTQQLMHDLKYRGNKNVGDELGLWMGHILDTTDWSQEIDIVVPVPLHKKRLRKRGYNQVEGFGKAIADCLKVPYNDNCLIKTRGSKTQVFKNISGRFKNIKHSFQVREENTCALENKHILLVDDIVTTGATLETCAERLKTIPHTKISIATMAKTS